MHSLKKKLTAIDQLGYKAYQQLRGQYRFSSFELFIDHVQGDPFAEPSRCRIVVKADSLHIPDNLYDTRIRRIALEDFLGRSFSKAIKVAVQGNRGAGRSGAVSVATYGQEILERNSVLIDKGNLELRLQIGLPAEKRLVDAEQASIMLFEELPKLITLGLLPLHKNLAAVRDHVHSAENQQALRQQLTDKNLVAFVADGSRLPRLNGVDNTVLPGAIASVAPDSLAVFLQPIYGEPIRGLGIPTGVTLIVGGGFHGKSTLLHALELGIYDHISGDGRERVVTVNEAVKVRAEDRRAISSVDISPFINNLPQAKNTHCFSTQDASGSTSQAANIMEALATGAKLLLIDEDTSATNFMIRDQRMQALISTDKEPITPLVERVEDLFQQLETSVVLVMGGSGDYFGVANTVIMMDNYLSRDVTEQARRLADNTPAKESPHSGFDMSRPRVFNPGALNPVYQAHKEKIQAFDKRLLRYGQSDIDLSRVEQIADNAQLTAIGYLIRQYYLHTASPDYKKEDIVDALKKILSAAEDQGLDSLTPYIMGTLAMPRLYELVATINRMRKLTNE